MFRNLFTEEKYIFWLILFNFKKVLGVVKFKLMVTEDHNIEFSVFYPEDKIISRVQAQDEKYNSFTQVAIRGGSTYYIDDLAIFEKK